MKTEDPKEKNGGGQPAADRRSWFPGHMQRTLREIGASLRLVDVVVELGDARIPICSRNPFLHKTVGGKKNLLLLNKIDLADPDLTRDWRTCYKQAGQSCEWIDAFDGGLVRRVTAALEALHAGRSARIRVMVVGIPNVGKSTLINRLAGRRAARVGPLPGVTRAPQWIRVGTRIDLLDTAGVLPSGSLNPEMAMRLVLTGAIRSERVPVLDQARHLHGLALAHSGLAERVTAFYQAPGVPQDFWEWLKWLAGRRGFVRQGGVADLDRAAVLMGEDFRAGNWGRITLDRPGDEENLGMNKKV